MKKITGCILAILMIVTGLAACSSDGGEKGRDLRIVTTIFPPYDWISNILGDHVRDVELTLLLDKGVDLHSYQPTTDDIVKISTCDVFVYVGGQSAGWVEDVLKNAVNKKMIVVDLIQVLGDAVKEEEIKEGMAHEDEDDDGHGHDEEIVWDEHVWLSLKNARRFTAYLAERLGALDPGNAEDYRQNAERYDEKLAELDARYEETVRAAAVDTLVFGDRFPFRYLVDDYHIRYHAAFPGCSSETQAGFETIVFLADKLNALGLKCIMTTESSDQSVAKAVIRAAGGKNYIIRALDSMQSVSVSDIKAGVTYLTVMENNLKVLKEALN